MNETQAEAKKTTELGGYYEVETPFGKLYAGRIMPCKLGPFLVLPVAVCANTRQVLKGVIVSMFVATPMGKNDCDARVLAVLEEHDVEFRKELDAAVREENTRRMRAMINTPPTQDELAGIKAARAAGNNGDKKIIV